MSISWTWLPGCNSDHTGYAGISFLNLVGWFLNRRRRLDEGGHGTHHRANFGPTVCSHRFCRGRWVVPWSLPSVTSWRGPWSVAGPGPVVAGARPIVPKPRSVVAWPRSVVAGPVITRSIIAGSFVARPVVTVSVIIAWPGPIVAPLSRSLISAHPLDFALAWPVARWSPLLVEDIL